MNHTPRDERPEREHSVQRTPRSAEDDEADQETMRWLLGEKRYEIYLRTGEIVASNPK